MRARFQFGRIAVVGATVGSLLLASGIASADVSDRVRERVREKTRVDPPRVQTQVAQPARPATVGSVLGRPQGQTDRPSTISPPGLFGRARGSIDAPGRIGTPRVLNTPGSVLGGRPGADYRVPSPGPIDRPNVEYRPPSAVFDNRPNQDGFTRDMRGVPIHDLSDALTVPNRPQRVEPRVNAPVQRRTSDIGALLGSRRQRDGDAPIVTKPVDVSSGRLPSPGRVLGGSGQVTSTRLPNSTMPVTTPPRSAFERGDVDFTVGQRYHTPRITGAIGPLWGQPQVSRRVFSYGPGRRIAPSGRVVVVPRTHVFLGFGHPRPIHRYVFPTIGTTYFYYPYYYTSALSVGLGVYPSLYFYYGSVPAYICSPSVVVLERPVYVIRDRQLDDDVDSYYLSQGTRESLQDTLDDIKDAWTTGDMDLLLRHVRSDGKIHVNIRGKYAYSLSPEDYRDMTKDAIANTDTKSFTWEKTERLSDDEVIAKARHTYEDPDGNSHSVYVSYRLVQESGVWWIAGVGTSNRLSDD